MSISAEKIIEKNWDEVKKEMRKTWRNLTENQVNKIHNYDDLVKQLKKSYEIDEDDKIAEKINAFIDEFDLQPNLTRFEEFKNSLYESAGDKKEKLEKAIKQSAEDIREKTSEWTDYAVTYSKKNPLKILGLGILAAVAIKKLIGEK